MKVYFDNAATTPVHQEVIKVITSSLATNFGNPSSSHHSGREAKAQLEESRRKIAKIIGAKPSEIIFNSCGTESNNAVVYNAVKNMHVKTIYTTKIEHPAIFQTVQNYQNDVQIVYLPLTKSGQVDLTKLHAILAINQGPALVTVMHANNEMGALNDLKELARIAKSYPEIYVHSDMVQTMGHLPIDMHEILVDFATASAHKFHGPKGVGFMYVRQTTPLCAMITGGSQERGFRSGTENLASIAGMATALELATTDLPKDIAYLESLRTVFREKIKAIIPEIQFLTPEEGSLCTVLSTIFPTRFDSDALLFQLDMKGIACSGGSACSSGANKPSHVLAQFDIPAGCKVVRFSFSKFNNLDEVDYCVDKIKELQDELKHSMA